jgi:hypothetical protein
VKVGGRKVEPCLPPIFPCIYIGAFGDQQPGDVGEATLASEMKRGTPSYARLVDIGSQLQKCLYLSNGAAKPMEKDKELLSCLVWRQTSRSLRCRSRSIAMRSWNVICGLLDEFSLDAGGTDSPAGDAASG